MALSDLMSQLQHNAAQTEARVQEAQAGLAQAGAMQSAAMSGLSQQVNNAGLRKAQAGNSGGVSTKGINPNADMRQMNFRGMSYSVNSTAAKRFQGFLRALAHQGYVPSSIGGYSDRNIAGTDTKSLHSYGLAIDIDPGRNGVQYGDSFNTSLPKNVGKLANRHGLVWGGDWNGSKKDPMHFSVPMFGTK